MAAGSAWAVKPPLPIVVAMELLGSFVKHTYVCTVRREPHDPAVYATALPNHGIVIPTNPVIVALKGSHPPAH